MHVSSDTDNLRPPQCAQNNLLRFPIINDYFRPDVAAHRRDEFARAKGYRWSTTPVSIRPPVGHAPTASVATQVS